MIIENRKNVKITISNENVEKYLIESGFKKVGRGRWAWADDDKNEEIFSASSIVKERWLDDPITILEYVD